MTFGKMTHPIFKALQEPNVNLMLMRLDKFAVYQKSQVLVVLIFCDGILILNRENVCNFDTVDVEETGKD